MHEHIFGLTDAASLRRAQWQGPLPATLLGRDALLVRQFQEAAPWGLDMALDLFGCDPVPMRSRDLLVAFTMALCDQLQMRRSGEPLLVHSGPGRACAWVFAGATDRAPERAHRPVYRPPTRDLFECHLLSQLCPVSGGSVLSGVV